jgi:hypothetical protein
VRQNTAARQDLLDQVASKSNASGGEVLGVITDRTSHDPIGPLRQEVEEKYGRADLLIAFAPGGGPLEAIGVFLVRNLLRSGFDSPIRRIVAVVTHV